jgi:hypothetical protein
LAWLNYFCLAKRRKRSYHGEAQAIETRLREFATDAEIHFQRILAGLAAGVRQRVEVVRTETDLGIADAVSKR